VAARAEIHAAIAATMPLGTMARDFAVQFLAAQDCMDALKRNLRSEHVLIHEFLSTFYTQARRCGAALRPLSAPSAHAPSAGAGRPLMRLRARARRS